MSAVSASELGVTRHCGMWRKARYAADSELGRLLTQRRKAVGRGYLLHGASPVRLVRVCVAGVKYTNGNVIIMIGQVKIQFLIYIL